MSDIRVKICGLITPEAVTAAVDRSSAAACASTTGEAEPVVFERTAPLKEGLTKEEADEIKEKIEAAGGQVDIK